MLRMTKTAQYVRIARRAVQRIHPQILSLVCLPKVIDPAYLNEEQ
jgi:hypothetical protein